MIESGLEVSNEDVLCVKFTDGAFRGLRTPKIEIAKLAGRGG